MHMRREFRCEINDRKKEHHRKQIVQTLTHFILTSERLCRWYKTKIEGRKYYEAEIISMNLLAQFWINMFFTCIPFDSEKHVQFTLFFKNIEIYSIFVLHITRKMISLFLKLFIHMNHEDHFTGLDQ